MENKGFVFFDERMEGCRERQRRLQGEDRGDEANFERIRENVYDIFKTVVSVAVKNVAAIAVRHGNFLRIGSKGFPRNGKVLLKRRNGSMTSKRCMLKA